jgi:hypothetical protein
VSISRIPVCIARVFTVKTFSSRRVPSRAARSSHSSARRHKAYSRAQAVTEQASVWEWRP